MYLDVCIFKHSWLLNNVSKFEIMKDEIAIKVDHVSKTFRIPHEKISSLRGAAINAFKKKSYEEFQALDDVSFEVKKGEFFGIIGRNGSGKSTLLKVLAGIYQADKGKVHINGLISPFLELGIGFNPELSGRDNVYLNATVLGMTRKQIDKKFDDIVAFSELERFIDQKLKNYSSGMQVRLAFSVAIHANREILLMDEVLAVGDTNFQRKCINEFEKYKQDGKTVILVTHDVETVKEYCDRVLLINGGRIISLGDPRKVVDDYMKINMTDEGQRLKKENEEQAKKFKEANKRENDPQDESSAKSDIIYEKEVRSMTSGRFGNKKAIIESYGIYDHNGREAVNLEVGNKFKITMTIKCNERIKNPSFGAMFRKNLQENLYGIHSLHRKNPVKIDFAEKGEILHIELEGIFSLNPGLYYLSLICASQESYLKYELLDSLENTIQINATGLEEYWGVVNADNSKISIER